MSHIPTEDHPRLTPAVQWLIATNIVIYFLQLTFVSPGDMQGALGFEAHDLMDQPWTVLTYMFVHGGLWHLVFNMMTLWFFGPRVEHQWGAAAFTRFYFWCGLGGWLFHLVFARQTGLLIGASGAIMGVMLAYAMQWPDDEVLFFMVIPMKIKRLVIVLAGMNLVLGLAGGSGIAYFAHLGGLAFGWLYLRTPTPQSLDRLRQRVSPVPDVPDDTPRAIPRGAPRSRERVVEEADEIVAKSKAVAKRPALPAPRANTVARKADELNHVLDKISERGLDSLTSDERRLLEEMSKRLRDR